jgi:hypothetical protein
LPTNADHKAKIAHNEDFVNEIDNPYFDWKVTGMFYVAVHYVDAYLDKNFGYSPENHGERMSAVSKVSSLKTVLDDYRELLNESRDARYDVVNFSPNDLTRIKGHLDRIKKTLQPLI